jgi:hypothetical protein
MTAIDHFLRMMRERRQYKRGSAEHEWRSNAARKYWWMHKGKPTKEWTK